MERLFAEVKGQRSTFPNLQRTAEKRHVPFATLLLLRVHGMQWPGIGKKSHALRLALFCVEIAATSGFVGAMIDDCPAVCDTLFLFARMYQSTAE